MATVNVNFEASNKAYGASQHLRLAKGTVTSDAAVDWKKGQIVDCKFAGGDTAQKAILWEDATIAANATKTVTCLFWGDVVASLYTAITAAEKDELSKVGILVMEDL